MALRTGKNLIEEVISDFFTRLEGNPALPKEAIKALKSVAEAGELNDSAAVQTALQQSLRKEHATS